MIDGPIGLLLRLLSMAHDAFVSLIDLFDTSIIALVGNIDTGNNFVDELLVRLFDVLNHLTLFGISLGQTTLFSLLLGSSLSLFVVITIGKWVLGVRY